MTVVAGQHIGWTCRGDWHLHLSEFIFTSGDPLVVNPLRPGRKLEPYADSARPEIREIRFYAPATPAWTRRPTTSVARFPPAGTRYSRERLFGRVDVRVRVSDPQSFIGWFGDLPWLAAPHHPFRLAVTITDLVTGRMVRRREAFRAEQVPELPASRHYAPGTEQNLPAAGCMLRHSTMSCDGTYWFRLFLSTGTRRSCPMGATKCTFGSGTSRATSRPPASRSRSRTVSSSDLREKAEPVDGPRQLQAPVTLSRVAP